MSDYGTTRKGALRAYNEGLPSLLLDSNWWKTLVEDHRWGKHGGGGLSACPACDSTETE